MVRQYRSIGSFARTASGGTPSRERTDYFSGSIRWVTSSELNDSFIDDTKEHISEVAVSNSTAKIFPPNTLLIAMYGATIGKLGVLSKSAATNQACCAIFPDSTVDPMYLFYSLLLDRSAIIDKGCGAGQPNISQEIIKSIEVPVCSIDEQKRVANVLIETDALICDLQKLLAKKKAIKHGTMQELLTGKRRLPGFTGKWMTRRLSEICQLINGRAYSQNELLSEGKYRVLRLGNLFTNEHWYHSNLELPEKQYCVKGDLLYAWSATFGPHVWEGEKTIFHYHIWKIELIERICKEYMYHYLKYDVHELMSELQGGTMVHLTKDTMEQRPILLPSYDEQAAIAGVLSDMDNEIEKLEQKLAKYRQIKQGMMQQLLTGKIRLKDWSE